MTAPSPDLIHYFNQGLSAWFQHHNIASARENFQWCITQIDPNQCDLYRALAGLDRPQPPTGDLLESMYTHMASWGRLVVAAGRTLGQDLGPDTPLLGMTVPVIRDHELTITLNTATAVYLARAVHLSDQGRLEDAWNTIAAAPSTIPAVTLVKVAIQAAAQRWHDVIAHAEPILSAKKVNENENTLPADDDVTSALAYLYSGIGYAHLGQFDAARSALATAEKSRYRTIGAEACYYRGLICRASGDEQQAAQLFSSGLLYQRTDKLAAALDDPSITLRQTTAELIRNRGAYWDRSTEADLAEVREAQRVETQSALLAEAEAELAGNIGMADVKEQVRRVRADVAFSQEATRRGMPLPGKSLHMVFTGPPGTGKTTIARVVAKIFCGLGVLRGNKVIEARRDDLVGAVIGETEEKTNAVINSALDGVLFIDEAYALVAGTGSNDFGPKALEVLLARMENERDRLVVIIAGYEKDINQLLAVNEGLHSRFTRRIRFASYSPEEIGQIAEVIAATRSSSLNTPARDLIVDEARAMTVAGPSGTKVLDVAGNARFVRNVIEAAEEFRSARLDGANLAALSNDELFCLLPEDVAPALRNLADPLLGRITTRDDHGLHHNNAPATQES